MKKNESKISLLVIVVTFLLVIITPIAVSAASNCPVVDSCSSIVKDNFNAGCLIECYVSKIFNLILNIASLISLIMIIVSGFMYVTSQGNPDKVATANKTLTGAIIGMIIVVFSFGILLYVQNVIGGNAGIQTPEGVQETGSYTPDVVPPAPGSGGAATPATIPDDVKAKAAAIQMSISQAIDGHTCANLKNEFRPYYPSAETYGESTWTSYLKDIAISSTSTSGYGNADTVTVFYKIARNGHMYYDVWKRALVGNGYTKTQSRQDMGEMGVSVGTCNMTTTTENQIPVA